MPERRAEIARRWLDAVNSEDFDGAVALVHPDVTLMPPGGQAPHKGAESLRRWLEPDAFTALDIGELEMLTVSQRTVLARHRVRSRGRATGLEVDVISWSVWTFDDEGLITQIEIYLDRERDKALESARRSG